MHSKSGSRCATKPQIWSVREPKASRIPLTILIEDFVSTSVSAFVGIKYIYMCEELYGRNRIFRY